MTLMNVNKWLMSVSSCKCIVLQILYLDSVSLGFCVVDISCKFHARIVWSVSSVIK